MSYNCCSGTFSSRSLGDPLLYPGSGCGSSYPSNLVYTTDCCSPSTCQQDSSLYSGSYQVPDVLCGIQPLPDILLPPKDLHALQGCSLGAGSRSCYSLGFGLWLPSPEPWIRFLPSNLLCP
ncbi:Keratin-associated protein 13-2 [Camelus dromedarius]|uniref:Keratin-associated protein n=1 Tax=Camelus dromedarius TaxID=9838 RepID=A0A5N4EI94_CAMDR|nr:Keratin-associated protein 13-2 [Camelus dromedarius]